MTLEVAISVLNLGLIFSSIVLCYFLHLERERNKLLADLIGQLNIQVEHSRDFKAI